MICSVSPRRLVYVGEGVLRDRIIGTWARATRIQLADINQHKNPKLHLLSRNRKRLGGYEAVWAQGPTSIEDMRRRKGHERRVLWRYRYETGRSALANYGRAALGLNPVGLDDHVEPQTLFPASIHPIEPAGYQPFDVRWMGLRWTHVVSKEELKRGGHRDSDGFRLRWMRRGPSLYKALTPGLELRKVGYTKSASAGAFRVYRDLPAGTLLAWANLNRLTPRHQCLELKSDLIGAHLEQTGETPSCQF